MSEEIRQAKMAVANAVSSAAHFGGILKDVKSLFDSIDSGKIEHTPDVAARIESLTNESMEALRIHKMWLGAARTALAKIDWKRLDNEDAAAVQSLEEALSWVSMD